MDKVFPCAAGIIRHISRIARTKPKGLSVKYRHARSQAAVEQIRVMTDGGSHREGRRAKVVRRGTDVFSRSTDVVRKMPAVVFKMPAVVSKITVVFPEIRTAAEHQPVTGLPQKIQHGRMRPARNEDFTHSNIIHERGTAGNDVPCVFAKKQDWWKSSAKNLENREKPVATSGGVR